MIAPVREEDLKVTSYGEPARFVQSYAQHVSFSKPTADLVHLDVTHVPGERRQDMLASIGRIVDVDPQVLLKSFDAGTATLPLSHGQFDALQTYCGPDHALKGASR